ncbi:conserved hypothetical protein [Ricinus communis]|uniref:Uncharacterized protein n=1 Tax=Ricinus communis TaxID=3988 RepID=B9SEH1_RICCO|nr:conserved hypothetical protein [Ricinus communis]
MFAVNGEWNWCALSNWVGDDVIAHISAIEIPSDANGEDIPFWIHSPSGNLSVK